MKKRTTPTVKSIGLLLCVFMTTYFVDAKEAQKLSEPVDLVYPLLDSENSRWFFFSSACRPFGMVNLTPDTEIGGAWGSGYRYKTNEIKGFSHVHAWQLSGLSVMPINLKKSNAKMVFTDFYSPFSHEKEIVKPGYHKVHLERYNVNVELSSTKRVGFHKLHFPKKATKGILFNLNTKLGPCSNIDGELSQLGNKVITGKVTNTPTRRRPKSCDVFFRVEFNASIKELQHDAETGNYLVILEDGADDVLMKVALSYTSTKNAEVNLNHELAHWDFTKVVEDSRSEWNHLLQRIRIEGGTLQQQRRFYTDLWHALQGRRTISDVNGAYPDNTGSTFRVGQLPVDQHGIANFNHYNSDAFWGAQWTINTLWGLIYPEIMEDFCYSLLQYYKDGGLVPRGPSGGNYTFVMSGASSTPFLVSAIQKGVYSGDALAVYEALRKNHMPGGIMEKIGYEHDSNLGGGLKNYINDGYVPYPNPDGKFGFHQDGASLTMEYAYQDWTLAQLAKKLGKQTDVQYFTKRSKNYKNVFNPKSGWMHPKNVDGKWRSNFDPYEYEHGFNESNGAQSTWFVPHDFDGLAELMGGKEQAVKKLNQQFVAARKLGFTSGDKHDKETHPEYVRVPINYGNQPSMQTAHIFQFLDRPDLTQQWVREVVDSVYSGLSPATGYNGDEDQGLMGSLAVLLKVGLFQMNGGTETNPAYQITKPIFDKVSISLNPAYYPGKTFDIITNNKNNNFLINELMLNGKKQSHFSISHKDIIQGGILEIK